MAAPQQSTRRNARRAIVFVVGVLAFRLIGGPWLLAALSMGIIVGVSVQRSKGSDRRGKEKRGVAVDAPVHASGR